MFDSATPRPAAWQTSLPMRFSRQEYWSGLPFPSPGDLPYPGINRPSPALAGGFSTAEPPGKPWLAVDLIRSLRRRVSGIPAMTKEESFCFPNTFLLPAWPFPTPTLGVVLVSPESQNKSRGSLSSSPGPSEVTPDSSLPSHPPPAPPESAGGLPQVYTAWVAAPPTLPPC